MTGKFPPRYATSPRRARLGLVGGSLVSVSALLWATQAFADTTIGSDRSTPIDTATANNGAPDNIVINGGVTISPPGGAAVTLDSNNSVTNGGTIKMQDKDDVTGILVDGGFTGTVTNNGTITLNETGTVPDTNGDGVPDGPWAKGTGKYGIRVVGTQPFVGDISNGAGGTITVQGNNSYGISVEAPETGALSNYGILTILGDNSVGLNTTAAVSGTLTLGGTITAEGQNAQGASINGDVGGQIYVDGTITSTGYRVPTRPTDQTTISKLLPSDLEQGGPAVSVGASAAGGLLIDTTGVITANDQAPGLQVGAVGRDITFGVIGVSPDNYGIENRGTIAGNGVYDGISAIGAQIGFTGAGAVTALDGMHNEGTIEATSYVANATGVVFGAGANVSILQNDGVISSAINNASGNTATGVLIQAGASVPTLANSSTISATVSGATGDAYAIQDLSGTLTSIQNIRTISTTLTSASGPNATGSAVAIDVSHNTTGVDFVQYDTSGGATPPAITGDIDFGSGNDTASVQAGTIVGALKFGAGANSLSITGGASITGALSATGGTLALSMDQGSLTITGVDHVNLTSLTLTGNSALTFTADPVNDVSTELDVAGPATLPSGAKIGLRFASLLTGSQTFTLIRSTNLSVGTIDTSLLGQVPFLYTASLVTNQAQGTLGVTVTEKSPAQLGLSSVVAPALNPVLTAVSKSPSLEAAFLAQSDASGFHSVFNQLLPSRSSAMFEMVSANAAAAGRAIDDRQGVTGGAWAQEVNFGATDKSRDGLPGYDAWGVGLVGGYEAAFNPAAILGLTVDFSSSNIRELSQPDTGKETVNTVGGGVYWRATAGRFSANARVGADYLTMSEDRPISILNPITDAFTATASSHWSGYAMNARVRASYEGQWGAMFVRPQVGVDYDRMNEDARTETGAGDAVDLAIDARDSSRLSGFAGVSVGAVFGDEATWGPELLLGYRGVASENLGDTTARFVSGGDPFTLAAEKINGSGVAAHLALKGENGYGGFAVEGGAETRDGLTIYDLRLTAHMQF